MCGNVAAYRTSVLHSLAVERYVSCERDEEEYCASRAALMKAISGLCCFRRDSSAASPEFAGDWELTGKSFQGAAEEIQAQLYLCF